jgi:hypothetical protein
MQIMDRADWTVPLVEAFSERPGSVNLAGPSCRPVPKILLINYGLQ